MAMSNILLATGMPIYATGLSEIIKKVITDELDITAALSYPETLLALAKGGPHTLVLDMQLLKDGNVLQLQQLMKRKGELRVLVLYEEMAIFMAHELYRIGVLGILKKEAPLSEVEAAIAKVNENQIYIEDRMLMDFIHAPKRTATSKRDKLPKHKLTIKEMMVTKLLMEGKSNTQICGILKLRPSTISTYKSKIYKKMNVTNLMELKRMEQITA